MPTSQDLIFHLLERVLSNSINQIAEGRVHLDPLSDDDCHEKEGINQNIILVGNLNS